MSGVQLSVTQYKNSFFSREGLELAVDKGLYKAKEKFGAFLARRMSHNIRKRNRVSKPGETPTSQTGTLRNFIFFAYDNATGSVIVGPAKTNQKNAQGYGGKTIPQTLERGGLIRIFEHQLESNVNWWGPMAGQWVRTDFRYKIRDQAMRSAVGRPRRVRWAKIEARPFVRVSAEQELGSGKHAELLRGIINRG